MTANSKSLLCSGATLLLLSSPALAQQAPDEATTSDVQPEQARQASGQIVVTATRRAESLKDVPQSISALSDDMLQSRGVTDITALGRQTPGLVMNERADKTPNVVMRGIGAFGNVQGVGFYIDDVQNFTDQTMRLQDLERVEILKGPQGTLYGGSSIGGAVRYITKQPDFYLSGEALVEGGGYGYRNAYAAANVPLVADKMAVRVSGYYNADDGFWTSPTIPDISKTEEFGIRGQLLVQPTDSFKALLTVRYRNLDGGGLIASGQDSVDSVTYVADLSEGPNVNSETIGFVGNLSYDFGGITLDSISSYTHQDKNYLGDVDYTTTAPQQVVIFTDNPLPAEVLTQEIRLSSDDSDVLNWIVGLYAANLKNVGITGTPVTAVVSVPAFDIVQTVPNFFSYQSEQTDLAAFASTDLLLGDLTVTTGVRLYKVIYDADLFTSGGAPVNQHFENDDTTVLPRLALSYETAGGTNIYASVSRGYEPGRAALSSDTPSTYAPEKTWAFELGSKGYLGDRTLYYEIAGFYTLYSARQFETRIPLAVGGFVETVANIGDSTAYGFETSLNWSPVSAFTLTGSLGYLHSQWDDGAQYDGIDISGRDTPNSPEWTGNVGGTFTHPLTDDLELKLHADASYTGEFRWKLDYDPISSLNPDFWLASAYVSIGDPDDRWKVSARVSNLFDQDYFLDFTPQQFGAQNADGSCDKCHLGYVGERRRLTLSASVKF